MLTDYEKRQLLKLAAEKDRRAAQKEFLPFIKYTKADYVTTKFHESLALTLEDFALGRIKRLIVMAPPRHGKSEQVSRRLPAFIFGINPSAQIIGTSYSAALSSRMNRDVQRIMDSDEYRRVFPGSKIKSKIMNRFGEEGTAIRNNEMFEIVKYRGTYRSAGIGGGITGMGADVAIIDDPIKDMEQAFSESYREMAWEWYTSTLYSRLEKNASILLTLTRWHEDDLAGRIIQLMKDDPTSDQFNIVRFPAVCDEPEPFRDIGDALWPDKYSTETLYKMKSTVGTKVFDSLWQQRPSSAEGGMIKRNWIKFYRELPGRFDEMIQSWDLSVKQGQNTDYTVGHVWGRKGADKFLLDRVRDRMGFPEEIAAIRMMHSKHKRAYAILVEEMANGAAVIQTLQNEIPGIVPYRPKTSKQARLASVTPDFEAGNVYFPDPSIAPWVNDTIEELVNFPNGKFDDEVDATSQALIRLRGGAGLDIPEVIKNVKTMAPSLYSQDW